MIEDDFQKIRGALLSQIRNNQQISDELIKRFAQDDFSLLEEHTVLSKIVIDAARTLSDIYKNKPQQKSKVNLEDLME